MIGSLVRSGCFTSRWVQTAVLLGGWLALGTSYGSDETYPTTAEQMVESARQAEVMGDAAQQFALLREAVRTKPDYELARWQLGQIKVGDTWMPVEEAQRQSAANPLQAEYRELRQRFGDKPSGQLALARWCRTNGLEDEALFHWASILAQQPNHREALRALDARWADGKLKTRDQIEAAEDEGIGSRRAGRTWKSRVAAWQRVLSRDRLSTAHTVAIDEIRAITKPASIPAMETATLSAEPEGEPGPLGRERMGQAFVAALEMIDDQEATESLVRHAVLAGSASVRTAATEALRERPLHDFVPILLDGLAKSIESSYQVVTSDDGSVHYMHSLYREGAQNDWKHETTRAAFLRATNRRIMARLANDVSQRTLAANVREAGRGTATAANFATQFSREASAAEQQVAAMNDATAALNKRIIPVLTSVTGKDLGGEPRAWWDWWTDENGYYQDDRPVVESNDSTYAEYTPPVAIGGCECFAAGTMVWTKTGQQPIQTLNMGDLVLAQDVNTGELAYKPVIGRTIRPPSPLLRFTIGRETIVSTQGHPFWVAGVGWRMAKELEGGAVLHGVTGSTRVAAIDNVEHAPAYNLVVADFSTYFVGEAGILVHDNTPRRPTRATVPGLAETN